MSDFVPVSPEDERAWLFALADLADVLGPVSHDLHNQFNALVLQAAVLTREVPEALKAKVSTVRKVALQASELVAKLDRRRQRLEVPLRPVDLAAVLADVAGRLERRGVRVERRFGAGPLPVRGVGCELSRLAELLAVSADDALRADGAAGAVTLEAVRAEGRILLHVEDAGPGLSEEQLREFFDPFAETRPGVDPLRLAACHVIARRMGAEVRVASRGARGVRVTAELQPA